MCLRSLVDLVRFELTTSSMPFKKYQSLADSLTQNKRLSKRRRGLRWTPRGEILVYGLHADSAQTAEFRAKKACLLLSVEISSSNVLYCWYCINLPTSWHKAIASARSMSSLFNRKLRPILKAFRQTWYVWSFLTAKLRSSSIICVEKCRQ